MVILVLLATAACSPFLEDQQTPTEPLINREQFAREGTAIAQAAQTQGTAVAKTAVAVGTYVAERESINSQLVQTLRAVVPPTQQIVSQSGLVTPGMNATVSPMEMPAMTSAADSAVQTRFVDVATALSVRDNDGCAVSPVSSFSTNVTRIYATARALNIRAGTQMAADWLYNGTLVYQSSPWTVSVDDDDFCLWFYVEPDDFAFSPGSWSVQLYANGVAIQPSAAFTIG
ncbi:MAG: hypothetical protein CUN53_11285 [Phototrophicales bacterium]|nr:MAG: hypothetical protein CUN53_11285 [Phototrophicales bacterium]